MSPKQPVESPSMKALRQAVDPFGMLQACAGVQQAWMSRPAELAKQLGELSTQLAALQVQTLHRGMGLRDPDLIEPVRYDERFQDAVWYDNPFFDHLKEVYLLYTHWLQDVIESTPDVATQDAQKAGFLVRQVLNAVAPSNYFWTNPAAILKFLQTGGRSLVDGFANLLKDVQHGSIRMTDDSAFVVGENLATTPGAVVYRNELLEVIQYSPATDKVHPVPIVLVAPWINKYYILDLNPRKSLIHFLVKQGFTVFVTSWKNPGPDLSAITLDDYMLRGVLQAVEVAREVCAVPQVHLTGYCIGGTMVAALMAWLNRGGNGGGEMPVAHWSLFTTLVDFSEPGEIGVFIDEPTIEYLERRMAATGYLDGKDMADSFRALSSNSLVWHYFVHNYLLGEELPRFDVLFWNMDSTRMPQAMHSFYLRELYLNNRLVEKDGLTLGGRPIDLGAIRQPLYAVGAEQDHIAPWESTFRIGALVGGSVRYVLATSGHILGIINPPVDPPRRRYWAGAVENGAGAAEWRAGVAKVPGSWWDDWIEWLRPQCGEPGSPPALGGAAKRQLCAAPGSYVLER